MKRALLLVFIIASFFCNNVFSQNISNEGTDFWTVFPTHVPNGNSLASLMVFVTSKFDSEVTVTCGAYSSGPTIIPANTSVGIQVNRNDSYIPLSDANQVLSNRGIHIVVTPGKPKVAAYAHMFAGNRSAASLILPFETLGQKYFSVNYTQNITSTNNNNTSQQGYNYLALVAVEDNTVLIIRERNNISRTITLPKSGDVYEYTSGLEDLTGISVETDPSNSSCKRFAAFSGTSNITIGNCSSADPLYQQIYPVSSLGKTYGIIPFFNQSYIYRAVAVEDNTKIYENGSLVTTLNKGGFYSSSRLSNPNYVTGDKNFILSQYMYSVGCATPSGSNAGFGDPDMVLLNPVEFNVNNITVFSATDQDIRQRYLNVLIKTNKTGSFKINGVVPNVTWSVLSNNLSYAQIPVTEKSLTLTADEGFNVIAYGYGTTESYAYSAGTNLASNNYLTVVNNVKKEEYQNGCINTEINFKINLPYKPDKITWTLDNEQQITTTNEPEVKVINGQTFYIYSYPNAKNYTVAGEHKLNVVAHVPNDPVNCQEGNLVTNYIFSIYDLPTSNFDAAISACAKTDVIFTDKSISNSADFQVTNWLWDFGDGTVIDEKNPKHQYLKEGTYDVKLIVKAGSGCYSDVFTKNITINPLPVSKFTSLDNTCINTDYVLTDASSISLTQTTNKIVKWRWDFGDNNFEENSDNRPVIHQYSAVGTYKISLITTSANGCVSEAFVKDVKVTDLPTADFTMPDVCLNDAFALFVNKTIDEESVSGPLKYEWNFGDAASTAMNPNTSTDKDGKHKYSSFGVYKVSLKITNVNGCESTESKDFTVNGAVEKADFSIQNADNLCSNSAVVINNLSKAFFGKITKIDIFKDLEDAPNDFETYTYPTNEDINLVYTAFGGNSNKDFKIKLIAYSGESCFLETEKTITLKPAPILEFADIPFVCQNDGLVIINQAKETTGIIGNGIYSGDGIDSEGNFNPKRVQAGKHTITYTFTASNGCISAITKDVFVYESPSADIGSSTLYILAGGEITIPAVAEGKNLTYKWSPSLGLKQDDVLNPVATPDKDTEYKLEATSSEGCKVVKTVLVKVLQVLVPPNSFTPNGDGVNDVWAIKYLDTYPNATIDVFNRNGGKVFSSVGYKTPFDGNYQNEPLPVGVYYYLINPRNGRKTITGPLTIIR
ncbi:PKD domain-containing protein [Pedobacter sp. Leaf132]|uniref:PKD domain-containing protein n=1 Tax=Pedobacter sp. Leaf132 TaxID=2876557 RepID=UPI001E45666A|nr:PKD domain-containing protein [Pedobacter sp. Leaf132]